MNKIIEVIIFFIVLIALIYVLSYKELEINKYDDIDEYILHIKNEHPDTTRTYESDKRCESDSLFERRRGQENTVGSACLESSGGKILSPDGLQEGSGGNIRLQGHLFRD